jgi:hypothetical protein
MKTKREHDFFPCEFGHTDIFVFLVPTYKQQRIRNIVTRNIKKGVKKDISKRIKGLKNHISQNFKSIINGRLNYLNYYFNKNKTLSTNPTSIWRLIDNSLSTVEEKKRYNQSLYWVGFA